MTEIERIIKKGVITEEFLKPETKCEFYVDEKRKKVWAIEIDLLLEIDKMCKKYGLKYYMKGGTLLGAVRHKGFIPWDDDLDIIMTREDYDTLISHADEFDEPYFLQTADRDDGYYYSFIKFRNSNTTCASEFFLYEKWNMGIFIDIFPLDHYVYEEMEENYEKIRLLNNDNSTCMRMSNPNLNEANKKRVAEYAGGAPKDNCAEILRLATQFNDKIETTNCLAEMVCTIYKFQKKVYYQEELDEVVYLDFENIKVPAFKDYDVYLKRLFGDYMQFPPVEQRGTWHDGMIFDPDKPYTEYIKHKED